MNAHNILAADQRDMCHMSAEDYLDHQQPMGRWGTYRALVDRDGAPTRVLCAIAQDEQHVTLVEDTFGLPGQPFSVPVSTKIHLIPTDPPTVPVSFESVLPDQITAAYHFDGPGEPLFAVVITVSRSWSDQVTSNIRICGTRWSAADARRIGKLLDHAASMAEGLHFVMQQLTEQARRKAVLVDADPSGRISTRPVKAEGDTALVLTAAAIEALADDVVEVKDGKAVQKPTFRQWKADVDVKIAARVGVCSDDLIDQPWMDWYRDGVDPDEAAIMALEDNGFDFDGDEFEDW